MHGQQTHKKYIRMSTHAYIHTYVYTYTHVQKHVRTYPDTVTPINRIIHSARMVQHFYGDTVHLQTALNVALN